MLRDYQLRAVEMLRDSARRKERPVLVIATGGGKTAVVAEVIRSASARGRRCLFLVHRRELIRQGAERLRANGLEPGIIAAGQHSGAQVIVASVQTLARRTLPAADVVILDEAHHARARQFHDIIQHYIATGAFVAGCTATPARYDGKGLVPLFTEIVQPITTAELIAQGYLIAPTVYSTKAPDLTAVTVRMGDFAVSQLGEAMNRPHLIGDIVEHWRKRADGKLTVAFAVNIEHSIAIRDAFRSAGIAAEHLDGRTPKDERDQRLADLASGRYRVLVNCQLLGEGWDLPALECAILARPTRSLTIYLQQIGRIARASRDKTGCTVLDHAGNTHAHGFMEDERTWSLAGVEKRPKAPPVKNCPQCFRTLYAVVRECPECGYVFVVDANELRHDDGELVEITRLDRAQEYARLVRIASDNGYRLGWARNQYRQRFGVWPRGSFVGNTEGEYVCSEHVWETVEYGPRRAVRCSKCYRSPAVAGAYT